MNTTRCIGFALAMILGLAPRVSAISFNEIGDGGNLPAFS